MEREAEGVPAATREPAPDPELTRFDRLSSAEA